jgi:hypothetical protein
MAETLFEVRTPLGYTVHVRRDRWELIVGTKHPVMRGREGGVQDALANPDQIRLSRSDPEVHLYYRAYRPRRWVCAAVKRLNGDALLVTAYPTDAIKAGEQLWTR